MTVDASLQIRKLPPSHISQLSIILEFSEQWKKLMAVIPNKLEKENFQCFINCSNPAKYNADHIRLIEAASVKYKRTGTEILLDEWGCSGKVRPSVGHLLQLLLKAELYRAADYVSERILCEKAFKRPSLGPAAQINVNGNIEDELERINYSSSLIEDLRVSSFDKNLNFDSKEMSPIPQIAVSPDADELTQSPLVFPEEATSQGRNNMSGDSRSNSDCNNHGEDVQNKPYVPQISIDSSLLPELSELDQSAESSNNLEEDDNVIPNLSILNHSENQNESTESCALLPNLSGLNLSENLESSVEDDNVLPNISTLNTADEISESNTSASDYIPSFSQMNQSSEKDKSEEDTVNLPDISGLIQMSSAESHDSTSSNAREHETDLSMPDLNLLVSEMSRLTVNTFDSSKSRKCNSPLPNLTLTTHLPHYMYEKLKSSTNEFNEEVFEGLNKKGRLLGSGAFGKVFLATGILQEPVAVKKILLGNVEVVDVDDTVTKQFINEVEVLSKYRHKNLVSLLGFSCDGCTYCLLYEFISGGTLKDRLQVEDNKLTMQERLSIALGTANAITYLHTAFPSPLIHRDIKTANILLDQTNKPKLGDFGITTLLDNRSMNTTTVIGTSAYMAPEAMRGDISIKCDTFSFGVVLLELLTSLPPLDENRDGNDLITHVVEKCEDSIDPLLDISIGSWSTNDVNFGDEIFSIACQCIEEKKKRPAMVDVTEMLMIVISKL